MAAGGGLPAEDALYHQARCVLSPSPSLLDSARLSFSVSGPVTVGTFRGRSLKIGWAA